MLVEGANPCLCATPSPRRRPAPPHHVWAPQPGIWGHGDPVTSRGWGGSQPALAEWLLKRLKGCAVWTLRPPEGSLFGTSPTWCHPHWTCLSGTGPEQPRCGTRGDPAGQVPDADVREAHPHPVLGPPHQSPPAKAQVPPLQSPRMAKGPIPPTYTSLRTPWPKGEPCRQPSRRMRGRVGWGPQQVAELCS